MTETQPLTDATTAYAQDVVSGKIVAGENVRLACQRHLDDLKHGHERGLTFDVEAAQDAIEFFPAVLSITEGAKEGQPFELLPWHVFVVGSVFGWKGDNGFIRFRFIWLETGKGQAKSPLMAAIAIYLQGFYGKKRAEVYCIGEVKDTAKVVFRDAVSMLRAPIPGKGGQTLEDSGFVIRGTGDLAYKIEHPASESYMSPIANGDAVSGPKPIMVAGDEIHEMRSNKGIELWKAAVTKKHGDSIMMLGTNTPSIDQTVGTEYSDLCQKVMRGEFPDDSLFAYIARVDKKHTQTYNLPNSLLAIDRHCTCNFVPTIQTHESIAKVYANHAISSSTGQHLSSGVKITLIEKYGLETSAQHVTIGKTETTKNTCLKKEFTREDGLRKTGKELQNTSVNGQEIKGQATKLIQLAKDFCDFMERHPTTSTSYSRSKIIDVLSVLKKDPKLKNFASIIAMNEMLIEGLSATNATQELVCSEIISTVLKEHSSTCGAQKLTLKNGKICIDVEDDDPLNDESCWIKALPALGITYPIDNIRKLVVTAKHQISTQSMLKRLYFGIPIGSAGFWTSETAWEQSKGVVDENEMKGRPCHLSLDLSQKNDLTAVSACWEGEQLAVKTWYWTREFEVETRSTQDHIPYRDLEADGKLTITPGRVIDYSFVAKQIIDLCASQNVVQMAIDSAHMEYLLREFAAQNFLYWVYEGPESESNGGLKIVRHKQGKNVAFVNKKDDADSAEQFLYMPKSITQLEDKMLNEEIIIDDNKLTTICASNTVIDADAMNNRMFDKNRSRGRIDGMVTIAMAVGSATSAMEIEDAESFWETS